MNRGEIILYEAADGTTAVEVRLDHDTVWLTQKQMAQLFQTERSVITKHLRNIFRTGELDEKSNVQKMHIPLSDKPVAWSRNSAPVRSGLAVRGTKWSAKSPSGVVWRCGVEMVSCLADNRRDCDTTTNGAVAEFARKVERT
ncbi:MAG: hypothetical protein A3K19_02770 [Lentisphaerae bacterium RIFOXYB12_FULL_65_16]|nr:MAG: hypothetical protein A3K18_19820 [Lentisphaerae bacterium RIFOXYA12_64_32]OGV92275.1 MAG: hypothetical protein A3K19_02770 [Lentisphaerae bacterium RIFOXYB12_FULL_65_16]